MSRWELLRKVKNNHKWFRCMESGRIACADYSGKYPHQTDDGILWLNKEKPIIINHPPDCSITVITPIIAERTGGCNHIISSLSEMAYLMEHHGMDVEIHCEDGNKLSVGALKWPTFSDAERTRFIGSPVQYKRNDVPDGPKIGSVSLSPRGDWRMPSDAVPHLILQGNGRLADTHQ